MWGVEGSGEITKQVSGRSKGRAMIALLLAIGIIGVVLVLVVLSGVNGDDVPPPECSDEEAQKILAEYELTTTNEETQ